MSRLILVCGPTGAGKTTYSISLSEEVKTMETHIGERKHAMRKITTRVYYPGAHRLEILINGVSIGSRDFCLDM